VTGWGIRLRKWGLSEVPVTLWAYVGLTLAQSLIMTALEVSERPWWLALLVFGIVFSYLMLRGFRVIWWLSAIGAVLDLVTGLISGIPWWRFPLDVVYLALLAAPSSRHYVFPRRSGGGDETTQVSRDPDSAPDSGRAAGWHVDPVNSRRMRYWNPELGEWQGKTGTPRKIRKAWEESRRPDPERHFQRRV
jgi:hypothetical protein